MNPVNATALYVAASRAVLRCDPRQPHTFSDMYSLLPFFRQSLACLVCGKLLQDPISTAHPECEHYVCLACKGQKMRIRTSCNRCKDYSSFQENKQLSLLVQCYRRLCVFVAHSPLLQAISSPLHGSPEVLALLEEVLVSCGDDVETEEPDGAPASESSGPAESESSAAPRAATSDPPCTNGPQDCNGEVLEDLEPSSPELEVCELVEEPTQRELSLQTSGLEARPLAPAPACSLRDADSRGLEEGEVLLLSVEEVLQTLDPIQPDAAHLQAERTRPHLALDKPHTQMFIQLDAAHNYSQVQKDRTSAMVSHAGLASPSSLEPAAAFSSAPIRLNRKRSRSESDREKVVPLPIGSILNGPSPPADTPCDPPHTPHPPALSLPPHTFLSFSNGAPPKSSRGAVNHCKGPRKSVDPKKPHAKARSGGGGGSKSKERSKDPRLPPGCPVAQPPIKPPYKKPVEKKGCKCGRATQNPSVLTCRGQRCPCYSNRKACLDCICRGCQNSFMANGEKKLEAFAVPEKALEQTRLTLGINLTSITAAAALRSPATTSIRTNTLLNVATATGTPVTTAFLTASPPQESSFEDSLELLIG